MLNRIARRLSPLLDEITIFHDLTESESFEFDFLYLQRDDLENNMTLSKTTETSIARREKEFGIIPDDTKPLGQRREVLLARYRSRGTTTPEFIRNVARSFQYGEITVDESTKPYTVTIRFQSIMGIPANLEDFKDSIKIIMPAHLALDFVYKYLTWDDFESYNKTSDEWDNLNITWDELQEYDGKERV